MVYNPAKRRLGAPNRSPLWVGDQPPPTSGTLKPLHLLCVEHGGTILLTGPVWFGYPSDGVVGICELFTSTSAFFLVLVSYTTVTVNTQLTTEAA